MRAFDFCKTKPSTDESLATFSELIVLFEKHSFITQIEHYYQIKLLGSKLSYYITLNPYEGTVSGTIYKPRNFFNKDLYSLEVNIFPNDSNECADIEIFIHSTIEYLLREGSWILRQDINAFKVELRKDSIRSKKYTDSFRQTR